MGERKGVNKYYPPDYDPAKGGLNKFLGTHALRERARKIHLGIIIIRFEMPYNIWCDGCQNHIGMGVRYNAEKTKVGMYYSTPIYQFRMKCHLCDNHFEIKTDPANFEYVIVSGARRQENRWDPEDNEQVVTEDKSVIKKIATDAMFSREHGADDKDRQKEVNEALTDLEDLQFSRWKDDFSANMALRQKMRNAKDEQSKLKQYPNLSVPLLASSKEDERMAAVLKLSQVKPAFKSKEERQNEINAQSVLRNCSEDRQFGFLSNKESAGSTMKNVIKSTQKTFSSFSSNFHSKSHLGIQPKNSRKVISKSLTSKSSSNSEDKRVNTEKQNLKAEKPSSTSIVSYESSESD